MLRWMIRGLLGFLVMVAVSAGLKWATDGERIAHASAVGWHQLSRNSAQLLPDASGTASEAIVMVLAAPTYGWRGYFAVHPWIIFKAAGQSEYERYEVIRWGGGDSVVRRNRALPDGHWFGAEPRVLASVRGPTAQALIEPVRQAIESYPYHHIYRTFPGPNSNTFMAHIGREVPELALDLPPTAIGKDYRPLGELVGRPPSGQGVQISVAGLLGAIVSLQEGIELNLLGLGFGIDFNCPAIRLPFLGRLGMNGSMQEQGCFDQ